MILGNCSSVKRESEKELNNHKRINYGNINFNYFSFGKVCTKVSVLVKWVQNCQLLDFLLEYYLSSKLLLAP